MASTFERNEFRVGPRNREDAVARIEAAIVALPADSWWSVKIEPLKSKRSDAQNGYLFGVCYPPLSDHTGYEIQEIHTHLCGEFFGWKDKRRPKTPRCPSGWESVPIRTTTRDEQGRRNVLPWDRFSDYVEFVRRFAAEKCSIVIPDPDPEWQRANTRPKKSRKRAALQAEAAGV